MKLYFTILLLFMASTKGFTQIEPINISFVEAQPLWVHTVIDTTFKSIPNQPYWTKYSSLVNGSMSRKGDNLFIISYPQTPKTLDDYGFVLDKINIKTGKKIWTHHNTLYNKGIQDFYHQIDFDKNENIELFGVYNFEKSKSILKTIDYNDGTLKSSILGKDSIYQSLQYRHYTQFKLSSTAYLSAIEIGSAKNTMPNPTYDYGLTLRTTDSQLNFLKNKRTLFNFDSLGAFSIDQPSFTRKLNNKTLISLAYKDRYESFENKGTKIMWIDVSNPSDIKTTQIKDFTALIPGTKYSFISQKFETINNTIFLSQRYPNFNIKQNTAYALWLDSIGGIKTYVPIAKNGKHLYELCDMIYAKNNFGYVLAVPSVTGKEGGIDILRIEQGIDTLKYVSSLTTSVVGSSFGAIIQVVYEDGYILFGGICSQTGQKEKTAVKIHCFNAKDLGIDFKSSVATTSIKDKFEFTIYPNPTSGIAITKSDYIIDNQQVMIYNNLGELVAKQKTTEMYSELDLNQLSQGIYFIELCDGFGKKISEIKKLIKL